MTSCIGWNKDKAGLRKSAWKIACTFSLLAPELEGLGICYNGAMVQNRTERERVEITDWN